MLELTKAVKIKRKCWKMLVNKIEKHKAEKTQPHNYSIKKKVVCHCKTGGWLMNWGNP